MALNADRGGLGDVQPCGGALAVIFSVHGGGNATWAGPHARKWRHDDPIWKVKSAELKGLEEDVGVHERELSKDGSPNAGAATTADQPKVRLPKSSNEQWLLRQSHLNCDQAARTFSSYGGDAGY